MKYCIKTKMIKYVVAFLLITSHWAFSQNISYTPLYNYTSFDGRVINVNLPVGSIQGFADVTSSGGSSYTIPISTPPGTNQITPSISVAYHSQLGSGLLGMGWDISGLSFINRVPQNMYFDGQVNPVSLDNNDRFMIDTDRLILISGSNGAANSTYGKEQEDFSVITSKSSQGNGPQWFEVITKDGIKMEYGNTVDSRHTGQSATVLIWGLSKIVYPDGNYITFSYLNSGHGLLIDEINYTGNTSQGISPFNKIKFEYGIRSDPNTAYQNATAIDSRHLLSKITTYAESQIASSYQFNYGNDNINSYLKEVIRSGADGTSLNATIFQYGSENGFSTSTTPGYENPVSTTIAGDFNGDGLSDFLAARLEGSVYRMTVYTKNSLYSTNPNDFFVANTTDVPATYSVHKRKDLINSHSFLSYDFNGDAADDVIMTSISGTSPNATLNNISIYQTVQNYDYLTNGNPPISFNPAVFIAPYTGYYKINPSGNFLFIGDFNGDGVQDLLTMLGNSGNVYASHMYYGNISSSFLTVGTQGTVQFPVGDWAGAESINVLDFNGDGKSDIMIRKAGNCEILTFDGYQARRIYFSTATVWLINAELMFGDFNGDRKTDILSKDIATSIWRILISDGYTFLSTPFTFLNAPDPDPLLGDHLAVADLNGDGKSDIYHARDPSGSVATYLDIYYCKGFDRSSGIVGFHSTGSFYILNLGAPPPLIGDFNGDGRTDAVNYKNSTTPLDIFYFGKDGQENRLLRLKNGFNHSTSWDYSKLSANQAFYTRGNLTSLPINTVQPAMYAVYSQTVQVGSINTQMTQYSYEGAKIHRGGKGFLGFTKISTKNLAQNLHIVSENSFDATYFVPYPYKQKTYKVTVNTLLNEVTFSSSFVSPAAKRFWIKTNSIDVNNVLEGRTSLVNNTWDNFGNVTVTTTTLGNGSNTIETENVTNSYGAYLTAVPNRLTYQTVSKTRSGEAAFSVSTAYGYNGVGQLTSKTEFDGLAKSVNASFEYFPLGNLKKVTILPSGLSSRVVSFVYDGKGRFPISNVNVLGQSSSNGYDARWGKVVSSTKVNGLITSYQYDPFGNLKRITYPQGYSVDQSYGWDVSGESVWYSLTSHPGKPDSKIWFDVLGREIKTEEESYPSGWVSSTKQYDWKGNLSYESHPVRAGESGVREYDYQYDDLNRLIKIYDIGNSEVGQTLHSYGYTSGNLLYTTSKSALQVTSVTIDPAGKVISSTDNGGTLNYKYYSHGGVKEVKNGTITLSSSLYDGYGNQTSLTDINAGTTSFTYDALGQLVTQTNANNQTQTLLYDLMGNPTSKIGPEGTTTYERYLSGTGINQLKKITGFAGNVEEFTYDSYGNLNSLKETIDGQDFTTTYAYNSYRDLTTLNYASGFGLKYNYDANGFISTIKNSNESVTIFSSNSINGSDQITGYTLGNGKSSTRTFKYQFPLSYVTSGIQNLEMTWDYAISMFSKRKDLVKNKEESFTYDNLDRLTSATVGGASAQSVSYSTDGNISTKTDVGTYSYTSSRLNAVTQVTNSSSTIPTLSQNISYNQFLQPAVISENNFETTLTYGIDYERFKAVTKQNGSVINTRYYHNEFDRDITSGSTKFIHYVTSPAGLVCIVVRDGTSDTYNYTYTDHLGSILSVTNSSGNVIAEQNFDAWGRRRDPSTWALLNPTATTGLPSWLFRGYTGHEHLDNFGLINMNGRVYDPVLGRVLSPDNYVMDGYNTQDYNRYSYARNNPMIYTDPDGQLPHILIGALVGGVVNLGIKAFQGKITNFRDGIAAFGIGAAAGAVTAATGGLAAGAVGLGTSGFLGGAVTGAVGSAVGDPIRGIGNSVYFGDSYTLKDYGVGVLTGGAIGGVVGGIGSVASGRNFFNNAPRANGHGLFSMTNSRALRAQGWTKLGGRWSNTSGGDLTFAGADLGDGVPKDFGNKKIGEIFYNNASEGGEQLLLSGGNFPKLAKHFKDHASEWGQWGSISKMAYFNRAVRLSESAVGGKIMGFTSKQGWVFRYNSVTNEFLTRHPTGYIETFFRPENGLKYFLKQIELYGK